MHVDLFQIAYPSVAYVYMQRSADTSLSRVHLPFGAIPLFSDLDRLVPLEDYASGPKHFVAGRFLDIRVGQPNASFFWR